MGLTEVLRVNTVFEGQRKYGFSMCRYFSRSSQRLAIGGLSRHFDGQREKERTAGADFRFHPDVSGVQLDNLLHD